MIATPDQRLRVFVSSTLEELGEERAAIARAIESLHFTPVLFETGARPYPPRELYRAYLEQSQVFVGIYWQSYGWIGPGMGVSGLEEELTMAGDKPRLVYIKTPAPERDPRLTRLLERIQDGGDISYHKFSTPEELSDLVTNDLAVLISERFQQLPQGEPSVTERLQPDGSFGSGLKAFLFTDVVASTERLSRMNEISADVMRRRHFDLMRAAVSTYGGTEVKSLGDGLMVAFATSVDAVSAAVAMQQAVRRHNRRTGDDLAVRIGIQVGEVTKEGDDFFGRAVVEASRLCDAAKGGQILVSELVRNLSAGRSRYSFSTLGEISLKGLPDTAVYEVTEEAAEQGRLPLPEAPILRRGSPYIGRTVEQRRLRELWEEASNGRPILAVVFGEPGIGKTRFVAEFARNVHEQGAVVLWGRSSEGLMLPYQPFLDMIRFYVAHSPPEVVREELGPSAEFLSTIVPELAALFPRLEPMRSRDPRGAREQVFDSASLLLSGLTSTEPALFVLDDVQWADEASVLLLKHLLRSPRDVAALFIATCRDTEIGPLHPFTQLMGDLDRDRLVHRLTLTGLDETESGKLFGSLVGFDPDRTVTRRLATDTRGNPYFLEEVARQVNESGLRLDVDGADELDTLGVPEGVKALSQRRLERLSAAARDSLGVAAVVGERFDIEVVGAVSGQSEHELLDLMDEAVSEGLLLEVADRMGTYLFSHALIRQTLLEARTLNRRAAMHARVGEAIERLHGADLRPVLSDLAYHYHQGGRQSAVKAVSYGRAAGERALAMLAHEDAVKRFQEALIALDAVPGSDDAKRAELLVLLGHALNRSGDVPAARASFERGAELAMLSRSPDTLAHAALGYGSVSGFGGVWYTYAVVDEVLVRLLENALAARPEVDEPLRAQLLGSLAQALYWSPDAERMVRLSEEALAMARRLDDPAVLAHALDSRHVTLWQPDTLAERTDLAEEMLRLAERLDDRDLLLEAYSWLITDRLESGPIGLIDGYIDAHGHLAEELRQPYHLWYTSAVKAMRAFSSGDYDTTSQLVEVAWHHGEQAHGANAQQTYLVQRLFLGREIDELAPMVPGLAAYVEQTPLIFGWRCALAFAYAETGSPVEAKSELEYLAVDEFSKVRRDCIWLATLTMLAQVVVRYALAGHAQTLYGLMCPYDGRRIVVGGAVLCFGPVSRILGALARVAGRYDDALAHLEKALSEATMDDMPPIQARIQLEIARTLLERGDQSDNGRATSMLQAAEETARKLGMTNLLRDITAHTAAGADTH